MSDDLIARIRHRDQQALADFISGHRPQLMAFIERQLGAALRRKIEPDDVYQEASAEAVRAIPTAEIGDRDPFSWLCQISERRIIDLHRRFFGAQKRDAAKEVPLDRMFIETDSPFLAPVPHRGKRNEPAFVKEVAQQVAELRGLDVQEVAARTTANFYRFFHLDSKNPGASPKVAQLGRPAL